MLILYWYISVAFYYKLYSIVWVKDSYAFGELEIPNCTLSQTERNMIDN